LSLRALGCAVVLSLLAACSGKNEPSASEAHPSGSGGAVATPPVTGNTPDDDDAPVAMARDYVPASRASQTWGNLQLSETRARFASFDGELTLEAVGVMPAGAGEELAGAQVYRVTNADSFFDDNEGRNGFCSGPLRWLSVGRRSVAGVPEGAIWIGLLTIEDWHAYTPDVQGYCGGGLYVPLAPLAD